MEFSRTVSFYGGVLTTRDLSAVDTFISGLKAANLWTKIQEMGVFTGDYNASQVKLKALTNRTLVNNGYTSSDYGVNGYTGSTSKYFDTGANIPTTFSQYNFHYSVYRPVVVSSVSGLIGSSYTPTGNSDRFYFTQHPEFGCGSYFSSATLANSNPGLLLGGINANSGTGLYVFQNGVKVVTSNASGVDGRQTGNFLVGRSAGLNGNASAISFYSFGLGLTDLESLAFNSLVVGLQRSLGRVA